MEIIKWTKIQQNILLVILCVGMNCCKQNAQPSKSNTQKESQELSRIDALIVNLEDSDSGDILVVAHRADWRNAPENSLAAIKSAIEMGVDIIEIDVRETKDGHLVLMHDRTLDRTTSGSGLVKDWTLDSLMTLGLRDGAGVVTRHKIPTLEDALKLSQNKVLVNLDKSYPIIDRCVEIAKKTGTVNQIIVKGKQPYNRLKEEFGDYIDQIYYMPIINLPNENASELVKEFTAKLQPIAFEFTVPSDTISLIDKFHEIRKGGSSIWVNSLWPQHNAAHDDERALEDITVYDWFIDNNIDIIQTDRPQLLLKYLRQRGLHK